MVVLARMKVLKRSLMWTAMLLMLFQAIEFLMKRFLYWSVCNSADMKASVVVSYEILLLPGWLVYLVSEVLVFRNIFQSVWPTSASHPPCQKITKWNLCHFYCKTESVTGRSGWWQNLWILLAVFLHWCPTKYKSIYSSLLFLGSFPSCWCLGWDEGCRKILNKPYI